MDCQKRTPAAAATASEGNILPINTQVDIKTEAGDQSLQCAAADFAHENGGQLFELEAVS